MSRVARYGKAVAREGQADELAAVLLTAAENLGGDPGCELYLVNRQVDKPDVIWITELWRSQADLDVEDWQMIELELLGSKGPVAAHG